MKPKNKDRRRPGQARRPGPTISRKKIWAFRLVLMFSPLALLAALEISLRLAGYGYPTAFLLPSENHGEKTFIQNNQFGWRFFGPRMARVPAAISIAQQKPPGTVRIFVFGESAAFGDPQPRFGLPRMLQAILEARHPGVKFEVINAAMTGIDSHTIVPIARDCANAGGDVWVVYMGNNEVVGPFGAGTVFGPRSPPLPVIRASLALKATRTGQLVGSLLERLRPPPPSMSEWGGMLMFLNNRVRADDPHMAVVYHNFTANLADILHAGRAHGVGVVVSTVGVNLKDCAPFASLHRPDLSTAQLSEWQTNFDRGTAALQTGDYAEAQQCFLGAGAIDDSFAELRFRLGDCALALGDVSGAQSQFAAARDLDTLRFRCDSQLNQLIRAAASGREQQGIRLADAERALADASPNGLPGSEFFYEHVHLTFEGNYVLARAIAEQVEALLPAAVPSANRPWPEIAECARRLGFTDRARQEAVSEILGRRIDPPFIWQSNHASEMQRLARLSQSLAPADSTAALQEALAATEAALASHPDDDCLLEQLAELQQAGGDFAAAAAAAQKAVEILPSSSEDWSLLGRARAQQQDYAGAAAAYQQAITLDPQDVWAMQNDAICLRKQNRPDDAVREFKKALAIKPRFGLAWLGLGQTYEAMGRTNEALACYQLAVANPVHTADELITLARFCQSRNWLQAAATNFEEAVTLSPSDAGLRIETGRVLSALNRHAEAAQYFADAGRLAPDSGQAHFLCGLEWGRLGRPAEAEKEFQQAVRIWPDLVEARVNLGISLYQEGKFAAADASFEAALQRDPNNATALKFVQAMHLHPQSVEESQENH
jgi:tetratricopeptide (TPR) repeat protein